MNYTNSYNSSAALAAHTPEKILDYTLNAGAGAEIFNMQAIDPSSPDFAFIAKVGNTAPTSMQDGDILYRYAGPTTPTNAVSPAVITAPTGYSIWFFTTTARSSGFTQRSCLINVLP